MEPERSSLLEVITRRPKRLFAVGDIHGCVDELEVLIGFLRKSQGLAVDDLVLFIGDYIDRGPASRQVIDYLIEFRKDFPDTIFLKGNHEEMLLSYLGLGGMGADVYLDNGGTECFRSYGLRPFTDGDKAREQIPAEHQEFYQKLTLGCELAEFLFVHAGLDPAKPLNMQGPQEMLWIRSGFTANPHPFQKTIVFGHTPFAEVALDLPYKIGIDTGLVFGNKLTCVELVDAGLYQVDRGEAVVQERSLKTFLEG